MKQVLAILFAAGFTYLVSLLAGKLVLKLLRVKLSRMEEHFLGFLLGAACLSTLVFGLTAVGLARRGVFLALGVAIIAVAVWRGAHRFSTAPAPTMPMHWKVAFGLFYGSFAVLYLGNALLPEASPDGTAYHVAFVARYLREHHFPRITDNFYASFPQGIEMLFLFAFAFGKHTAAAMVHLLFTLVTPFGMLAFGRRIGSPLTGVAGALLFFLSPIVGKTGSSAYVDIAMASASFALFLLLEIWRAEHQGGLLVAIGLAAGFAYAVKYSAGFAIPYAIGCVAFHLWRLHKPFVRASILVAACSLAMAAPWMIKNAIVSRNPVSPFANTLFPNPYMSVWLERNYTQGLQARTGVTATEIPLEVTVGGGKLAGVMGPVFLLSPLLLIGLWTPVGRRLAFAALLFAIPLITARETRYLIPSLTFASLGMALVLSRWRAVAMLVVLFHALASWPAVLKRYVHPYTWRLDGVDWKAALRLTPEADFLRSHLNDYDIGLAIEKTVPPGEPVFSFSGIQQAYHSHPIIVEWTSSLGIRISETLRMPFTPDLQSTWRHDFQFLAIMARRIRVVQTARSESDRWSISELRVFRQGEELARTPLWRISAFSNPWDVEFAFDNNPVTRWTSYAAYQPGMYVEADFGAVASIDQVVADCSRDQEQSRMRLDYEDSPGHWRTVENFNLESMPPPDGIRRAAVQEVKRNHVNWLLVHDQERGANDFYQYQQLWGIRLAASSGAYKLYHLE